jgi:hypothetical protein
MRMDGNGEAPGLAAALEEVAHSEPLIAHPVGVEQEDAADEAGRRPGPWETETPLDATILRGLVHP